MAHESKTYIVTILLTIILYSRFKLSFNSWPMRANSPSSPVHHWHSNNADHRTEHNTLTSLYHIFDMLFVEILKHERMMECGCVSRYSLMLFCLKYKIETFCDHYLGHYCDNLTLWSVFMTKKWLHNIKSKQDSFVLHIFFKIYLKIKNMLRINFSFSFIG